MNRLDILGILIVTLLPSLAFCEEPRWGDLTGRFVYDGDVPKAKKITVTRDKEAFGGEIRDESLIVNPKNRGIANMVVYLLPGKDEALWVHPSYEKTAKAKVELAMHKGRFVPHVLLLRTTQTMTQHNKDKVGHNAKFAVFENDPMSPLIPVEADAIELQFPKEEPLPVMVGCNIHPWMNAYVLIRSNPYMAKTDKDGRFAIKNLPVGEHVFRLWHERVGYVSDVRIGSLATDSKGRLRVTIKEGKNELTASRLAGKMFVRDD